MKIHGVGASSPRTVVIIGIKDLRRQSLPAAGGTSVDCARPALADAAKLLFDERNQFAIDGLAVRADVGRIHGVGIVVVRVGVLDDQEQHARQLAGGPVLIKLVGALRALEREAGYIGGRRRGAECAKIPVEMALIHE